MANKTLDRLAQMRKQAEEVLTNPHITDSQRENWENSLHEMTIAEEAVKDLMAKRMLLGLPNE